MLVTRIGCKMWVCYTEGNWHIFQKVRVFPAIAEVEQGGILGILFNAHLD